MEKASDIRGWCHITHSNNKQVEVFRSVKPYPDCFVVEQVYKNKFQGVGPGDFGFREIMERMKDNPGWVYSHSEGGLEVWIGPRGGNRESAGLHYMAPITSRNKHATHISPTFQKLFTSRGMDENCRVRAVIHLWAPVPWMEDPVEELMDINLSPRNGMVVYLGMCFFHRKIEKAEARNGVEMPPQHKLAGRAEHPLLHPAPLQRQLPPPNEQIPGQLMPFDVEEGVTSINRCIQRKELEGIVAMNSVNIVIPHAWLQEMLLTDDDEVDDEDDKDDIGDDG
jgi:hypothetical protein